METHEHNTLDDDLAWIGRADGTRLIPVARAPQEIDLKHLRAERQPRRPLGRHVTAIRRGRRTRTRADGTRESVFTSDALAAAANAALWMNWIYEEEGFSTGRCVSLAEDVLSPNMLIVPGQITAQALAALAKATVARFAREGTLLLGVLPWLKAQTELGQRASRRPAKT